jgi:hypothetical protein
MSINFSEIRRAVYRYDPQALVWSLVPGPSAAASLKQVSVLSATVALAVDTRGSVWQWGNGQWTQGPQGSGFTKVAVGIDGIAWALDSGGHISRLNTVSNTWQQIDGTFADFDAKDGNAVVAVDRNGKVQLGSMASAGPLAAQRPTPFVLSAYSGGAAAYSDLQRVDRAYAQLSVNGTDVLTAANSSDGFNVVVLGGNGGALSVKGYDTGRSSTAGGPLVDDLTAVCGLAVAGAGGRAPREPKP